MAYDSYTNEERDRAEPNTTMPGDGKAVTLKDYDDMSYCNARLGGISVAQTGTVATGQRPAMPGLAYERGRELGKYRGRTLKRGS